MQQTIYETDDARILVDRQDTRTGHYLCADLGEGFLFEMTAEELTTHLERFGYEPVQKVA